MRDEKKKHDVSHPRSRQLEAEAKLDWSFCPPEGCEMGLPPSGLRSALHGVHLGASGFGAIQWRDSEDLRPGHRSVVCIPETIRMQSLHLMNDC